MELLLRAQGRKGKSPPPLSHERERERNKSCMNNWKCRLPILDIPASGFIPLIQNPRLQSANTTNCLLNSKALETKTLLAQAFCYRRLTPCCAIRSSENRRDREFYEFCTMQGCTVGPCRALSENSPHGLLHLRLPSGFLCLLPADGDVSSHCSCGHDFALPSRTLTL